MFLEILLIVCTQATTINFGEIGGPQTNLFLSSSSSAIKIDYRLDVEIDARFCDTISIQISLSDRGESRLAFTKAPVITTCSDVGCVNNSFTQKMTLDNSYVEILPFSDLAEETVSLDAIETAYISAEISVFTAEMVKSFSETYYYVHAAVLYSEVNDSYIWVKRLGYSNVVPMANTIGSISISMSSFNSEVAPTFISVMTNVTFSTGSRDDVYIRVTSSRFLCLHSMSVIASSMIDPQYLPHVPHAFVVPGDVEGCNSMLVWSYRLVSLESGAATLDLLISGFLMEEGVDSIDNSVIVKVQSSNKNKEKNLAITVNDFSNTENCEGVSVASSMTSDNITMGMIKTINLEFTNSFSMDSHFTKCAFKMMWSNSSADLHSIVLYDEIQPMRNDCIQLSTQDRWNNPEKMEYYVTFNSACFLSNDRFKVIESSLAFGFNFNASATVDVEFQFWEANYSHKIVVGSDSPAAENRVLEVDLITPLPYQIIGESSSFPVIGAVRFPPDSSIIYDFSCGFTIEDVGENSIKFAAISIAKTSPFFPRLYQYYHERSDVMETSANGRVIFWPPIEILEYSVFKSVATQEVHFKAELDIESITENFEISFSCAYQNSSEFKQSQILVFDPSFQTTLSSLKETNFLPNHQSFLYGSTQSSDIIMDNYAVLGQVWFPPDVRTYFKVKLVLQNAIFDVFKVNNVGSNLDINGTILETEINERLENDRQEAFFNISINTYKPSGEPTWNMIKFEFKVVPENASSIRISLYNLIGDFVFQEYELDLNLQDRPESTSDSGAIRFVDFPSFHNYPIRFWPGTVASMDVAVYYSPLMTISKDDGNFNTYYIKATGIGVKMHSARRISWGRHIYIPSETDDFVQMSGQTVKFQTESLLNTEFGDFPTLQKLNEVVWRLYYIIPFTSSPDDNLQVKMEFLSEIEYYNVRFEENSAFMMKTIPSISTSIVSSSSSFRPYLKFKCLLKFFNFANFFSDIVHIKMEGPSNQENPSLVFVNYYTTSANHILRDTGFLKSNKTAKNDYTYKTEIEFGRLNSLFIFADDLSDGFNVYFNLYFTDIDDATERLIPWNISVTIGSESISVPLITELSFQNYKYHCVAKLTGSLEFFLVGDAETPIQGESVRFHLKVFHDQATVSNGRCHQFTTEILLPNYLKLDDEFYNDNSINNESYYRPYVYVDPAKINSTQVLKFRIDDFKVKQEESFSFNVTIVTEDLPVLDKPYDCLIQIRLSWRNRPEATLYGNHIFVSEFYPFRFTFVKKGVSCMTDIGMGTTAFGDCQYIASSEQEDFKAKQAGLLLSQEPEWWESNDWGCEYSQNQYIQVAFLGQWTISAIVIREDSHFESFEIYYSFDTVKWTKATYTSLAKTFIRSDGDLFQNETSGIFLRRFVFDHFDAVYVRVAIIDKGKDKNGVPYTTASLRFKLYGCDFKNPISLQQACSGQGTEDVLKETCDRSLLADYLNCKLFICERQLAEQVGRCIQITKDKASNKRMFSPLSGQVKCILAVDPTNNELYGISQNGKVYMISRDGGTSWSTISVSAWWSARGDSNIYKSTNIDTLLIPQNNKTKLFENTAIQWQCDNTKFIGTNEGIYEYSTVTNQHDLIYDWKVCPIS